MKPSWYKLKAPYNNMRDKKIGSVMLAIQMVIKKDKDTEIERIGYKPNKDLKWYRLFYQIHSGFELATMLKTEKLNSLVEIKFSNKNKKRNPDYPFSIVPKKVDQDKFVYNK